MCGVFPLRLGGDDVGVEEEEDGLAGAVAGLVDGGEIELPPVGERQVGRIAERDAFAYDGDLRRS